MSPDGTRVVLLGSDGRSYLFPIAGGTPEPLPAIARGEYPVGWTPDGRQLYVSAASGAPNRIFRIDVATGRRALWKELYPSQRAGVRLSQVSVTPDGRTILHSYSRLLSNLYVVNGISVKAR